MVRIHLLWGLTSTEDTRVETHRVESRATREGDLSETIRNTGCCCENWEAWKKVATLGEEFCVIDLGTFIDDFLQGGPIATAAREFFSGSQNHDVLSAIHGD